MTFFRRKLTDQKLINHIYVTGHENYRILRNNAIMMAITLFPS